MYFSDDFRSAMWKAASPLLWNICIMFELHGKLQKLENWHGVVYPILLSFQ
jgi:hypothetical protein